MLSLTKNAKGELCAVAVGYVAKDATFTKVGEKQIPNAKFSIKTDETYDKETKTKTPNWLSCEAWQALANYAGNIEKGDLVQVTGKLIVDDFWTKKNEKTTYKLMCEFIMVQDFGQIAETEEYAASYDTNLDVEHDEPTIVAHDEDLPFA